MSGVCLRTTTKRHQPRRHAPPHQSAAAHLGKLHAVLAVVVALVDVKVVRHVRRGVVHAGQVEHVAVDALNSLGGVVKVRARRGARRQRNACVC